MSFDPHGFHTVGYIVSTAMPRTSPLIRVTTVRSFQTRPTRAFWGSNVADLTQNFNNNEWCEDGMGAPKGLTGKYQMPDQGYYIHMGRKGQHEAGCGLALSVGTRSYHATGNTCLFFYVPCPNGGDCDDCGRAQSAGSGDGVTYLASPQQTAIQRGGGLRRRIRQRCICRV